MLHVLKWCHAMVPSWTLAIILLTVLVKLLLLPLTQKSYSQMQRMSSLKPQMDALREKYGKDKNRLNQEMMNLYKREKVNPLGGCFPMLLQMPIWIALYRTIYSSAELYQAPMGLWIQDLSAPDPWFVMPLVLGVLMFLQQKMTPTATDSQQAKMMLYIMPVMFTVFMLFLPAGLNLYILVNTILSLAQQLWLKRRFSAPVDAARSRA
jgi:YidC/Oxa1 family membrane protein insertase